MSRYEASHLRDNSEWNIENKEIDSIAAAVNILLKIAEKAEATADVLLGCLPQTPPNTSGGTPQVRGSPEAQIAARTLRQLARVLRRKSRDGAVINSSHDVALIITAIQVTQSLLADNLDAAADQMENSCA